MPQPAGNQQTTDTYEALTRNIRVQVMPQYLADRSEPEKSRFFWAYRVLIMNESALTVQLVSRYWHITNAIGKIEEVRGAGVVGEQPVLRPGDRFEYTSGCPLATSSGFMYGTYTMKDETGEEFEAAIPAFALDMPDARPVLN
ncbi:MAG: Co2+/Mg2+ efflux protein ApaG [Rhizobiaceae bacterium]